MELPLPDRIRTLDLIRGVAVLGILAVNIAGFAGPIDAALSPHIPDRGSLGDEAAFAFVMVVFEGKMRMLFSMLFGASMALFITKADGAGRNGALLQARRLAWLALFGTLHYLLLWWGDILFTYAALGFIALLLRRQPVPALLTIAGLWFCSWVAIGLIATFPDGLAAARIADGTGSAATLADQAKSLARMISEARDELALFGGTYGPILQDKLTNHPWWLVSMALNNAWEILPMMLIGMALLKSGFFSGQWPPALLRRIAWYGLGIGGTLTLAITALAWAWHYPPPVMGTVIGVWMAVPRLMMTLGYAALLVLAAPRLLGTAIGQRIEAAGRMAFSNYLGTTLVMTALFYGWGFGLIGRVGEAAQLAFVALGWALMLGWSKPWLARIRQGPLEWLWRSLTEWRLLPLRRPVSS